MQKLIAPKQAFRKLPFCIDGRILDSDGTGVATYAATVQAALMSVDATPIVLKDQTFGRFGQSSGLAKGFWRRLRARSGAIRKLDYRPSDMTLVGDDVFRLAHVRFLRTGDMLTIRAPLPDGVMHWTYPIPIRIEGWSNIYTVHDIIPLIQSDVSPIDADVLRRMLTKILKSADRVATVSESSRQSILSEFDVSETMVENCGSAVLRFPAGELPPEFGLVPGGYFMFCGALDHRKNLLRLVEAYRQSGSARPLVIVGPDGDCAADLREQYDGRDGVRCLGHMARGTLGGLIAGARALLFPSLAEGFGLPVIEAMAVGTPVLTSDRGALAETAGGAAYLVSPEDVAAIADGIAQLDRDDALCDALSRRGRTRADDFALTGFGERLCTLYDAVTTERRARADRSRSEQE